MSNSTFASEVSICNQALGWLGADPITSLDDESVTAELCQLNYPHIRDAVLEERMWTFATVRTKSETADKDAWGDVFSHPIPDGWLAVYRAFKNIQPGGNVPAEDWRVEGGNILSRHSILYLWGLQRVTNTSQFSSMFVQCLAARIAADLCIPITSNQDQQTVLWRLYLAKLADAAARDGAQGASEKIQTNTLLDARAGGFTRG